MRPHESTRLAVTRTDERRIGTSTPVRLTEPISKAGELFEGRGARGPVGEIGMDTRLRSTTLCVAALCLDDAGVGRGDVDQSIPVDDRDESPDQIDHAVDDRRRRDRDSDREHHDHGGSAVAWSAFERRGESSIQFPELVLSQFEGPVDQALCHVGRRVLPICSGKSGILRAGRPGVFARGTACSASHKDELPRRPDGHG